MRIYWIWLASHPDLTDLERNKLLEKYPDPEDLYFAREPYPVEVSPLAAKARAKRDLTQAEKILEDCLRHDLRVITLGEEAYPSRLRHIADPPLVLYVRGSLPDLDSFPVIGVVGTRKASAYGLNTAWRLGCQIARCGGIVVSGMALGIDAMAMRGALTGGNTVVGVLGSGAEQIYPKANRSLFEDTWRYGCVLSEYPPGTPPSAWNFPRRNRIISGLSCGVLVVEAPERSGSMITARRAAEQGRDVYVVPGNVDLPGFAGSYQLLREGATPVGCGWDVVGEYRNLYPDKVRQSLEEVPAPQPEPERKQPKAGRNPLTPAENQASLASSDKKPIDKATQPPYIDVNKILPKLSPEEKAIVKALVQGKRLVDDVIAETGLTTGKMLSSMTMLELKGVIKRLPGKYITMK